MSDLVEALQIFRRYGDEKWPTHCEHDLLYIINDEHAHTRIKSQDRKRLRELGFFWATDDRQWQSFRYGSA